MNHARMPAGDLAGAVDAHVHVFDPARFPYDEGRLYTPASATVDALLAAHRALGIERAVLVQPSVYGTDNRSLLDAIATAGPARCRGIAVVDPAQVTPEALEPLHLGGVRGIRLNLEVRHEADEGRTRAQLLQAAEAVTRPGWCVQVHCAPMLLETLADTLTRFAVPVVLDHFGGLKAADGAAAAGSRALSVLLDLLCSGQVYVKCSAFYRASSQAPDHDDLAVLVRRLLDARPDRLLWGSDWPHTGGGAGGSARDPNRIEPFRTVDLPASLRALARWCDGDAGRLRQLLVDNPTALYGFVA